MERGNAKNNTQNILAGKPFSMGLSHFCTTCRETVFFFFLDYLFRDVCTKNNLGDRRSISL